MFPTSILRGGSGEKLPGQYIGGWGNLGSQTQKGIVTYALSGNRQRPLAGTAHAAVFNVFRRTRGQILYWVIPALIGYEAMNWATERNEFLNSKEGRALYSESEE